MSERWDKVLTKPRREGSEYAGHFGRVSVPDAPVGAPETLPSVRVSRAVSLTRVSLKGALNTALRGAKPKPKAGVFSTRKPKVETIGGGVN
jgi:hypothetical protein